MLVTVVVPDITFTVTGSAGFTQTFVHKLINISIITWKFARISSLFSAIAILMSSKNITWHLRLRQITQTLATNKLNFFNASMLPVYIKSMSNDKNVYGRLFIKSKRLVTRAFVCKNSFYAFVIKSRLGSCI